MDASKFVLDIISYGYKLPFSSIPDSCHLRNNRSALSHPDFAENAISKLLFNDCIQEHLEPPYCLNPLTVAEGKKLRLDIDLRHVNPCLIKHSFKYEDLHCLSKVFEQNFWFFTWISSLGTITWMFIVFIRNSWGSPGLSMEWFDISPSRSFHSVLVLLVFASPNYYVFWLSVGAL